MESKLDKINMPHRYEVTYEEGKELLSFEVELLTDAVVFYKNSAKRKLGDEIETCPKIEKRVEDWLRAKFKNVEVDET